MALQEIFDSIKEMVIGKGSEVLNIEELTAGGIPDISQISETLGGLSESIDDPSQIISDLQDNSKGQ